MADLSEGQLLQWLVKDPSWCLLYHRNQVLAMLPAIAKSHLLVLGVEQRLQIAQDKLKLEERD